MIRHLLRGRRESSPVRTDEFTVPLRQVGWGWGYGKTRWFRASSVPNRPRPPATEQPQRRTT